MLRFSFSVSPAVVSVYLMEDTQVARILELNDGTRMPVLGLGTWKVALTLISNTCCSLYRESTTGVTFKEFFYYLLKLALGGNSINWKTFVTI